MSEAFPAFGQNFRVLFSSLLAFSSSAIAAATLIISSVEKVGQYTALAYRVCILAFAITIIVAIISSYAGLCYEVNDGKGNHQSPRAINDMKFKIISVSLAPFFVGFISFIAILLSMSY